MNLLIQFFVELFGRIRRKKPAFFKNLQFISAFIIAALTACLWLNTKYAWGWEMLYIVKNISLPEFFKGVIIFLSAVFATSQLPNKDINDKK